MKKITLLLTCLLLTSLVAKAEKEKLNVLIGLAKNNDSIAVFDNVKGGQIKDISNTPEYNILDLDPENPKVTLKNIIIIRLINQKTRTLLRWEKVDNISVKITIGDTTITVTPNKETLLMTDYNIRLSNYFQVWQLQHRSQIFIEVLFTTDKYNVIKSEFNGIYFESDFTPYQSLEKNLGGIWFPTLQFSSTLTTSSDGVPFASLPIGIAWGKKYTTKKGTYFGLSIMGNWLIFTQPFNSDLSSSSSFAISNITLGGLIDLNDIVTIGYAYGWSFREGSPNPGNLFVLGFGSESIKFLKKDGNSH